VPVETRVNGSSRPYQQVFTRNRGGCGDGAAG
jgi:hypothetical protein